MEPYTTTRQRMATGAQRQRNATQPRQLAAGAAAMLVLWSATYLARQTGLELATPFSPLGDFALEGMVLAMAWLASVVAACVGTLAGVVVVRTPVETAERAARMTRRPAATVR